MVCFKIEYAAFDDTLPEDRYQDQQISCWIYYALENKAGGSFFYNHKVRYLKVMPYHHGNG